MEDKREQMAPMGRQGLILLALSMVICGVYQFAHPGILSEGWRHLPGIGLMVSQWAVLGVCLGMARANGRLKVKGNLQGLALLLAAMLTGLCYGLFANDSLRVMNLPLLAVLTAQTILSLAGCHDKPALSMGGLWDGFRRVLLSLLSHVALPFQRFRLLRNRSRKQTGVVVGICLGLVLVVVAASVLSSADQVFDGLIQEGMGALSNLSFTETTFWQIVFTLVCGLVLFSMLYAAVIAAPRELTPIRERTAPPAMFAVAMGMVAAVYALFVYVQIRFLLGGEESVRMAGGYAAYARSGFFQLAALAFLTVAGIQGALALCRENKSVRILGGVLTLLTLAIDCSAFYRMRLYIQAYGLTVLRVVTLWGMGAILAALVVTLIKCVRPQLAITPLLATIVAFSWLGLNFVNVDAHVAQYNVNAYNQGRLEELDVRYLAYLSRDTLPALESIQDDETREQALKEAEDIWAFNGPCVYDWSLSWSKEGK